jgi:arginase family enzyme
MFALNAPNSSRRRLLFGTLALAVMAHRARAHGVKKALVLAPSNLGLRPEEDGTEPGTWQAPEVLMAAGLERLVSAEAVVQLPRPPYDSRPQIGTRICNGLSLRRFSLELAEAVRRVMQGSAFPLVIGGDCSVLLGSLYGARMAGARGLIHVDGHSDFFTPEITTREGVSVRQRVWILRWQPDAANLC